MASAEKRINDIISRDCGWWLRSDGPLQIQYPAGAILLSFVETMNFINKEEAFFGSIVTSKFEGIAQFRNIGGHRVQFDQLALTLFGNYRGQMWFFRFLEVRLESGFQLDFPE